MRATISGIYILLVIVFLAACNSQAAHYTEIIDFETETDNNLAGATKNNSPDTTNNYSKIIERGSNFRIIQTDESRSWHLLYEIYNNNGEVVWSYTTDRPAWIKYADENLLEFGASAGTNVRWGNFYSIENDILSDVFMNTTYIKHEIIAYAERLNGNEWRLVVRNVFDLEKFYEEFFLDGLHLTHSTYVQYAGDNKIEIAALSDGVDFDKSAFITLDYQEMPLIFTTTKQIHENMPPFTFRRIVSKIEGSPPLWPGYDVTIRIYDDKKNLIQEIPGL